jgi:tRNA (guanine10-N2)-methyltransferase
MCNQALVKYGSVVIDPFVGTGGLLIPAASKGAITFGSDLDIRVINGYAVGRINKKSPYYDADKKFEIFTPKINLNFEQYELNIPNIIRIDSTRLTFRDG